MQKIFFCEGDETSKLEEAIYALSPEQALYFMGHWQDEGNEDRPEFERLHVKLELVPATSARRDAILTNFPELIEDHRCLVHLTRDRELGKQKLSLRFVMINLLDPFCNKLVPAEVGKATKALVA